LLLKALRLFTVDVLRMDLTVITVTELIRSWLMVDRRGTGVTRQSGVHTTLIHELNKLALKSDRDSHNHFKDGQ